MINQVYHRNEQHYEGEKFEIQKTPVSVLKFKRDSRNRECIKLDNPVNCAIIIILKTPDVIPVIQIYNIEEYYIIHIGICKAFVNSEIEPMVGRVTLCIQG